MLKLTGSLLVLTGTVLWGLSGVRRLRLRAANLLTLVSSLDIMRSEICDRLTPMPELLKNLSEAYGGAVSLFYSRVGEELSREGVTMAAAWRRSANASAELLLKEDEISALAELGLALGKYDAAEQRCAIEYTRRRMSSFADKAVSRRDSESKIHAFLGVAAGIFAVMILL